MFASLAGWISVLVAITIRIPVWTDPSEVETHARSLQTAAPMAEQSEKRQASKDSKDSK